MNNVVKSISDAIESATRRAAPEAVAGLMKSNAYVCAWVKDALASHDALRKILSEIADAKDVKAARAIAAKAANVPVVEHPQVVADRNNEESRKAHMELETRLAKERAEREKAERVEAARRELARIEAERKHEEELRALISAADGSTISANGITEPHNIDTDNLAGCRIEH